MVLKEGFCFSYWLMNDLQKNKALKVSELFVLGGNDKLC